MNASHLKSVIKRVIALDTENVVQSALARLDAAIAEAQKINSRTNQQAAVNAGTDAVETARRFYGSLSPAQKRDIAELDAGRYFNEMLSAEIENWLQKYNTAPNVGREGLHRLIVERQQFVSRLSETLVAFDSFRIDDDELQPGESEIEVTLPRSLFNNDLQAFQRELDALSKIIRAFYEINNFTPEAIEIKHISASDPVLTIAVVAGVALAIGNAVKLCIDILNGAYSLRKAMKDARASKMVEEKLISEMESRIHDGIESRVKHVVAETMQRYSGDDARRNELETHTYRAIKLLLERIERGMQIVPRVMLPTPEKQSEMDASAVAEFEQAAALSNSLEFPRVEGEPLLKLTHLTETGGSVTKP